MDLEESTSEEKSLSQTDAPKPVKLPYFHRTLSPEDQELIGDITPKPIKVADSSVAGNQCMI